MSHTIESSNEAETPYVSTGHLPPPEVVKALVAEAHAQVPRPNTDGKNSQVYPALARVPSDLFGICVVGDQRQRVYAVGDSDYEFYDHERLEAVRLRPGLRGRWARKQSARKSA